MQRDGVSEAAVRTRMQRQLGADERMARAGFVVYNGSGDRLLPQICAICEQLMTANNGDFS
jgi:dephospho-CoA kinase